MVHDVAVAVIASDLPSADTSGGLIAAIAGAITVVVPAVASVVVLFLNRRRDQAQPAIPAPPPPAPLNSDADDEEHNAERALIRRYERFMYRNNIDPTQVLTGDERLADVRIPDE